MICPVCKHKNKRSKHNPTSTTFQEIKPSKETKYSGFTIQNPNLQEQSINISLFLCPNCATVQGVTKPKQPKSTQIKPSPKKSK